MRKLKTIIPKKNKRDNLFNFIRHTKIQLRLIVSFVLISLIPLIITGVSSYRQSSEAIDTKIGKI